MRYASSIAAENVKVLGALIRAARLRRGWSVALVAERVGVTAATATKVERGDPSVSIGTVFEMARVVDVELFGGNRELAGHVVSRELALLPQRGRSKRPAVDNDF